MAERELIHELKKHGFKYRDIDEIWKAKSLEPVEVNLIIKWLGQVGKEHLGSAIILAQSVTKAKEVFDPSKMIELFETSDLSPYIKSSIAFGIIFSKTGDIADWMKKQLLSNDYSYERSALIGGLVKRGGFKNDEELKNFLELIFHKYPIAVLEIFNKKGNKYDIDFLLEQLGLADKKTGREIQKTLRKILKKEGIKKQ